MTHTETLTKLGELLETVETLRADAPIGPAVCGTVRATALRIVDDYLIHVGAQPPRVRRKTRTKRSEP